MVTRAARDRAPVIATVNRRKGTPTMSTLRLTSAHAGAYFQIGRDPAGPRFRSICPTCPGRPAVVWKLRATLTTGFPLITDLFTSALHS
jgi:hypothetical protein